MKLILTFAVLALSFAAQAQSSDLAPITGADAAKLMSVLESNGAIGDTGAGTYGVGVTDVQCGSSREAGGPNCSFTIDNQMGKTFQKTLKKSDARIVFEAMIDQEAAGCGMESCSGEAKSLDCSMPNDPSSTEGATCRFSSSN